MEIQVERFYYELLKTCLAESPKGNKIGMGFALSRYSFHLGLFGAAAEFWLGLAFRSMLDRIS